MVNNKGSISFLVLVTIFLAVIALGFYLLFSHQNPSSSITKTEQTASITRPTSIPTMATDSAATSPPRAPVIFRVGSYSNCRIYLRVNMNFAPSDEAIYNDKSTVECQLTDKKQTLLTVTDKTPYPYAGENNIYRLWQAEDGYRVLIVDTHGAGSSEGIGKIILLKNKSYQLLNCFYYLPEEFYANDTFLGYNEPLSKQQIDLIEAKKEPSDNPSCNDFSLESVLN